MLYSGFIAGKDGKRSAVVNCGMGDRLMGDAVLLLGETAVKKIIFAGACGGLGSAAIGDIVITGGAFQGEGFSRYQEAPFDIEDVFRFGETVPAHAACTKELEVFLRERAEDPSLVKKGNVFTIGSLVAEETATLEGIRDNGFIGIDMELSAVFKAAESIGSPAAAMVFVSDLPLVKPIWEPLTAEEKTRYNKGVSELVRLSVGFALK